MADLNAKGGVLGKPVDEIVLDDACDPKQAVNVANQMVADGVVMVDGHFCSASSIPASKVYADNASCRSRLPPPTRNIPMTAHPSHFRTCGRDDQQGKVAAVYISKHFKGCQNRRAG